jgi:hypothetical protein
MKTLIVAPILGVIVYLVLSSACLNMQYSAVGQVISDHNARNEAALELAR